MSRVEGSSSAEVVELEPTPRAQSGAHGASAFMLAPQRSFGVYHSASRLRYDLSCCD
jgi:hypothetical protein